MVETAQARAAVTLCEQWEQSYILRFIFHNRLFNKRSTHISQVHSVGLDLSRRNVLCLNEDLFYKVKINDL